MGDGEQRKQFKGQYLLPTDNAADKNFIFPNANSPSVDNGSAVVHKSKEERTNFANPPLIIVTIKPKEEPLLIVISCPSCRRATGRRQLGRESKSPSKECVSRKTSHHPSQFAPARSPRPSSGPTGPSPATWRRWTGKRRARE